MGYSSLSRAEIISRNFRKWFPILKGIYTMAVSLQVVWPDHIRECIYVPLIGWYMIILDDFDRVFNALESEIFRSVMLRCVSVMNFWVHLSWGFPHLLLTFNNFLQLLYLIFFFYPKRISVNIFYMPCRIVHPLIHRAPCRISGSLFVEKEFISFWEELVLNCKNFTYDWVDLLWLVIDWH